MKALHMIAYILVWVGGINWGLVGLSMLVNGTTGWNLVAWAASYVGGSQVEAAVYVLVGLAALWTLIGHSKDCKMCSA